jgi:integrase
MAQTLKSQADVGKIFVPRGRTEIVVYDESRDRARGLALRVRPGNSRKWVFIYRDRDGKQRKFLIGDANPTDQSRTDSLTLAEAQAQVTGPDGLRADVNAGREAGASKAAKQIEEIRAQPTLFSAIVERYLAARSPDAPIEKLRMKPRSHVECTRHLQVHLKPLHSLPIDAIERAHIDKELEAIGNVAAVTSDKVRSTLSAMYGWAVSKGICQANPVAGTMALSEYKPRERALEDAELAKVWLAAAPDTPYGRIVRMLILTACRRDEIGGLRWAEIESIDDASKAQIALPGERTKNGRPHDVALSAAALGVLATIKATEREFVFSRTDQGFSAWSKNKAKLDEAAGLKEPWTLHDLRRTARTGMGKLGIAPHVAEAVLNHLPPKLVRTYDRNTYAAEKRAALDLWANHVAVIVAQAEGANVVRLSRA